MTRALLILANDDVREKAARWIKAAPINTRVEFKQSQRSTEQNARMWAMLTDVATQLDWHGQHYSPDDWKDFFMHSLRQARWMPAEDGGMIPIGMRTSDLSKGEMGDLMELMAVFGANHGVTFSEPAGE
jgi:hypothetical protein